jgi:hypothetical protein
MHRSQIRFIVPYHLASLPLAAVAAETTAFYLSLAERAENVFQNLNANPDELGQ